MFMVAVRLVALPTLIEVTAIPGPKLTLEPAPKLVCDPVIVTTSDAPCCPIPGVIDVISPGTSITENSPEPVTGVPFVVTVTSRTPGVAPDWTLMLAVRLAALLNTTLLTVIPAPKLTVDRLVKLVLAPVIVADKVWP
jgi:hypothetical protein